MTRLSELEQRVATLEAEQPKARLPWFIEFAETLTEEEFEREADWIIPTVLKAWIGGGKPGYPQPVRYSELAELWGQWVMAEARTCHEISMGRLRANGRNSLFNFWSRRNDPAQEQLRLQLVEKLLVVLPQELHEFLTDWQPRNPTICDACPPHALHEPKSLFYRWHDEQCRKERE
ncbi:MAG TPA: hypothetical protein VH643_21190 [Gemmataceae bacterium]|jgi:hypothetical protein